MCHDRFAVFVWTNCLHIRIPDVHAGEASHSRLATFRVSSSSSLGVRDAMIWSNCWEEGCPNWWNIWSACFGYGNGSVTWLKESEMYFFAFCLDGFWIFYCLLNLLEWYRGESMNTDHNFVCNMWVLAVMSQIKFPNFWDRQFRKKNGHPICIHLYIVIMIHQATHREYFRIL